jgi:drug/metabolite transporter (DMT)-like permease
MLRIKIIAAFWVIYIVWGTTYLAIRLAVDSIPPFLMAGLRFTVAGILFFAWSYFRHRTKVQANQYLKLAISGIFMFSFSHGMLSWVAQYIPSGFISVLVATVPIWIIILEWISNPRKKPNSRIVAGILLGISGVMVLAGVRPDAFIISSNYTGTVTLSIGILSLSSLSWAVGSLYTKKITESVPIQAAVSIQTLVGGIVLVVTGLLRGEGNLITVRSFTPESVTALAYLILFGTILGYSSYIWLLNNSTPVNVSTYAFVNPVFALIMGAVLLNEPITMKIIIGAGMIILSIIVINLVKRLKSSSRSHNHDRIYKPSFNTLNCD